MAHSVFLLIMMVCLMSASYVIRAVVEEKDSRLVELLPEWRAPEEGIWALYPHNRHLSPKVRLLVDYLAERLSDPHQPALVRPIG